jgi:Metal binding domain of Ada
MPSIKEKLEKSKHLVQCLQNTWLFVGVSLLLIVAVLFGSFKLYFLFEGRKAVGVRVAEASFPTNLSGKEGAYVGSKTGKIYYFPWCGTVNRIKDANLVWFQNRAVAEAKGYKPSSNCHGLK